MRYYAAIKINELDPHVSKGKQTFVMLRGVDGTQEFERTGPAELWPSTPHPGSALICGVCALPGPAPHRQSHRQTRGRQKAVPEPFGP